METVQDHPANTEEIIIPQTKSIKMIKYSKQIICLLPIALIILVSGCRKAPRLTIEAELQQARQLMLPYSVISCCPDSCVKERLYFDEERQELDVYRDVNGNPFPPEVLANSGIEDGEYSIEWKEMDGYSYDSIYQSIMDHFITRNSVPEIDDLEYYFSDVPMCVLMPTEGGCLWGIKDSTARPIFLEKIHRLQLFKDGKVNSFPMDLVDYVRMNEQYISCYFAHAGATPEMLYSCLFQYRLMQQLARICPDIRMISSDISEDGKLAVDDINSTVENHFYNTDNAYIFMLLPNGRYATDIVSVYLSKVKIITDADSDERTIYRVESEYLETYTIVHYDKKEQKWYN